MHIRAGSLKKYTNDRVFEFSLPDCYCRAAILTFSWRPKCGIVFGFFFDVQDIKNVFYEETRFPDR